MREDFPDRPRLRDECDQPDVTAAGGARKWKLLPDPRHQDTQAREAAAFPCTVPNPDAVKLAKFSGAVAAACRREIASLTNGIFALVLRAMLETGVGRIIAVEH